ncbi:MAG: S8 family serine peptidase [Desulfurellaceae bacterium]|nr:S8 family serine peptidase [Desulfurellaceae bacterium]
MGKTLLRTAVWGLCGLLLIAGDAWAQTSVPGAPTIATVTAGRSSSLGFTLAVTWAAPSDTGGSAIEAYDVRYIETDDDETDDANWTVEDGAWTSGSLTYTISGLTDSTEYDVQVRAVNANGDGAWSATETGTPDHGDSVSEATSLTLDTPMEGVIDPGTDVDYFTFRLTRETGMLIWTTGDLDTVGELQNSSGTVIDSDDDGPLSSAPLGFFMWNTLAAGTYRIKVSSYGETTGSYVLRTRTMVDTSSIANAQEITFDSDGNGVRSGLIDPGDDTDYFTFTLSETTEIVIRTTGLVGDTVGTLLNSDGTEILAFDDDGYLWPSRHQFLIRTRLDAGTYSIEVEGFDEDDTGWYRVHVNKGDEPGNTRETAVPLDFDNFIAEGSRIDPSTDVDYFRLDLTETTNIFVGAVSETVDIDGELLDENGNAVDTNLYGVAFGDDGPWTFFLSDRLDAGTYYIRVTHDGADTGPYTIRAFAFTSFLDRCSEIDTATAISDPLYGCQWHLNNTRQLKGVTADEDINVEEVWTANNLGAGINVAVVDDGMDYEREDLSANVATARNHDYTAGEGEDTTNIFHPLEDHGTAVAGIIAARDNSLGVRGVAPRATIYGYNLLLDSTDANEADAAKRDLETDVSNNSWGPYDGPGLDAAPGIWEMAIEKGITEGSDDKGIFYVWAGRNGALRGDDSNLDGYANHYGVTAVCAVNDQGQRSAYSEQGANLWVCAPSNDSSRDRNGITTTDNDDFHTNRFGGTSAATPIVSGVAALVRSANSTLTWRDVKLILAASARQNDADNAGWEDGALKYGSDTETYHFNHEYGFGVVDAEAAVDLADGWTALPTLEKDTAWTSRNLNLRIPDRGTVTSRITMGSAVEFVEFVEINADFTHSAFRDLQVELTSLTGKVSVLSVPYPVGRSLDGSFRFGSAKHLGENPARTWTLRIRDQLSGDAGTLKSWSLTVYGHRSTPGAPDIDQVTPGPGSLTVVWKEPTNIGASAVTGYDVRYIKTSEDETNDANWTVADTGWTSGNLEYTISSLSDDIAYDVQVRAVNDQGDGTWSYTATETPSSDAPYFSEGATTTRSVDENATAGTNVGDPVVATDPTNETLTYTLSGTDAGSFAINDSTGQLTVASGTALDYEGTKKSYAVIVTATDPVTTDDPTADSDSINVTITVKDVDESPTLTGEDSVEYAENGLLPVATYTATDPEGESVTWSLTGTDSGDFAISNGILSFDSPPNYESPTDADGNNVYEVTVRASDGTSSPATLDVTVTVTPVDEVHTLTGPAGGSYEENVTGSLAFYTVSDPESVSPTWSLARHRPGRLHYYNRRRPELRKHPRSRATCRRRQQQRLCGERARHRRNSHRRAVCHHSCHSRG